MITTDDMITRFGENELAKLTDREHYNVIDDTVLDEGMNDAIAEVQDYIRPTGFLAIVINNPSKSLTLRTCDIARYYLYENGVTGIVKERYDQAIAWLEKARKVPSMLSPDVPIDEVGKDENAVSGIAVRPNIEPRL